MFNVLYKNKDKFNIAQTPQYNTRCRSR